MWALSRNFSVLFFKIPSSQKISCISSCCKATNFFQCKYFKCLSTSSFVRCDMGNSINFSENDRKYRTFLKKLRQNYDNLALIDPKKTLQLTSVVNELEKTESALTNINQTLEIVRDAAAEQELRDLAAEELQETEISFNNAFNKLVAALLAHEKKVPSVGRDVVLEVSAGVGGAEAMLFCQDLWNMYYQFVVRNGWQFVQQEWATSDLDGLRRGQALVCPGATADAYELLQHEAGVHRVQRVPRTERAGRMHTSTVAVVVMLQPTESDIVILPKDLKVEAFRSKGAGGQSVNTADSAVRVTHLPTGTVVECQQERAQHRNRALAMARLRSILYERERDEELETSSASRKLQLGTRGRSEKVRTYNFSQDRVTDHRIGMTIHNVNGVLSGEEPLLQLLLQLRQFAEKESLQVLLDSDPLAPASTKK